MPRRRSRRAWPCDTYAQRIARLIDVALAIAAPPTIVFTLLEHVLHVMHP